MVCIPCIVVPFFLFIWYRFIQPVVLQYWNPWRQVQSSSTSIADSGQLDSESQGGKLENGDTKTSISSAKCSDNIVKEKSL
ncbi:UPF0729 protein CG18508 isoform X2 [Schistocerca serialis cubense]|nr:UPF0729 protein CG18508 isoform X2 [Schistocerca serialis cubense]